MLEDFHLSTSPLQSAVSGLGHRALSLLSMLGQVVGAGSDVESLVGGGQWR